MAGGEKEQTNCIVQFDKRIIPQLGQSLGLRICFSAGELQDAVVGAGGKAETVHRLLQQHLPCSINLAIFTHHSAAHLRIREQPVTTLETLFLDFPRRHHPLSDVAQSKAPYTPPDYHPKTTTPPPSCHPRTSTVPPACNPETNTTQPACFPTRCRPNPDPAPTKPYIELVSKLSRSCIGFDCSLT